MAAKLADDGREAGRKRTYTDAFEMVVWDRHNIFSLLKILKLQSGMDIRVKICA